MARDKKKYLFEWVPYTHTKKSTRDCERARTVLHARALIVVPK